MTLQEWLGSIIRSVLTFCYRAIPVAYIGIEDTLKFRQSTFKDVSSVTSRGYPNHIALVLLADQKTNTSNAISGINIEAVTKFSSWCRKHSIRKLSVFEEGDSLSAGIPLLRQNLEMVLDSDDRFLLEDLTRMSPAACVDEGIDLDGSTLGTHAGSEYDLEVKIVGAPSGREALVVLCRELAYQVSDSRNRLEPSTTEVNIQSVESAYSYALPNIDEPQLLFILSDTPNRIGRQTLSPWHIRLSEIWPMGTSPSYPQFLEGLQHYANCHQRFGT
ncbi:hypothetical protein DFS34DRAFT_644802 [Phlyctochytrium arcticum]|nr:hypothetical protein DFS34DRAFT_644802 [Phlyctochytrium arcticum]